MTHNLSNVTTAPINDATSPRGVTTLAADATTISNEEIQLLPLKTFNGKITLIQTADELVPVINILEQADVLGFDTETRPSFKKGEFHQVALLQIGIPGNVFLIQLQKTGLPEGMAKILSNPNIIKAGVAIRDDIKALQKLRRFTPAGFVDLSVMARENGIGVESVKKLTALLLGFRISKTAQTSNWETPTLSEKQIEYAATDAWVCLEIYRKLV